MARLRSVLSKISTAKAKLAATRKEVSATARAPTAVPRTDPAVLAAVADGRMTSAEMRALTPGQRATAFLLLRERKQAAKTQRGTPQKARKPSGPMARSLFRKASAKAALVKKSQTSLRSAIGLAKDLRGGRPPPPTTTGQLVSSKFKGITGNAFAIAGAKQIAKAQGGAAVRELRSRIKDNPVQIVADHAQAVAEVAGLDYQRAADLYEQQIGTDSPTKAPKTKATPAARRGMKAINKAAFPDRDETLAAIGESPVGDADAEPLKPAPAIDPKVLMAAAVVMLLLLAKV